jgi:hypothetical protein
MTPGRSRLTLAERSALSSAGPADGPPPPGAVDVPADARPAVVRHCWVSGLPETQGRCAGLVAEWVRRDGCWCARVVYAVDDGGAVVLVEAWVSVPL